MVLPFTIGARLLLLNVALLTGLLVFGAAALRGVRGLAVQVQATADEYEELLLIDRVARATVAARAFAEGEEPHLEAAGEAVAEALVVLDRFHAYQLEEHGHDDPPSPSATAGDEHEGHQAAEASRERQVRRGLEEASLYIALENHDSTSAAALRDRLDSALAALEGLEAETDVLEERERATEAATGTTVSLAVLAALLFGFLFVATLVGYRRIMGPLRRLQGGVQSLARGEFSKRLPEHGPGELVELAQEFNHMAGELDRLYEELEERVRVTSRELVRAERLASVGFLAAGVAHEINNPLNIISGHAELSARAVGAGLDETQQAALVESLDVIRDEAFRCKDITTQLLSLSRMGGELSGPVPIGKVIRDVGAMLRGHTKYRDRRLNLMIDGDDEVTVLGNEPELKQVILNLAVNALEATDAGGEVRIEGREARGAYEVRVCDNGCGIPPDKLERVFEPFYTARRGGRERGTGLGLSICHAIVEAHGGRILAESDGERRGSCFTVRIPIHVPERLHA